jgi:hypothetical protein
MKMALKLIINIFQQYLGYILYLSTETISRPPQSPETIPLNKKNDGKCETVTKTADNNVL